MEFLGAKNVDELIRQDPEIIEQQIIDLMKSLQRLSRARVPRNGCGPCSLFDKWYNPQQKKIEQIPGPKTNEEDKTTNDVF